MISFNSELQIKDTKFVIRNELTDLLSELKGFKFVTTLFLQSKKIQSDDKTLYSLFYLNSKAETVINESDIDDVFESIYNAIKSIIQKSLGQGPVWIIDLILYHNINIWKYNPLDGSSYIKLPKELDHSRKDLINIQNIDDNTYFKSCLVRYLHPADHNPARITKADKDFAKKCDFINIKFSSKISHIHKIKRKCPIGNSVFGYENR